MVRGMGRRYRWSEGDLVTIDLSGLIGRVADVVNDTSASGHVVGWAMAEDVVRVAVLSWDGTIKWYALPEVAIGPRPSVETL